MKFYSAARLGLASALVLTVSACGSAASKEVAAESGRSDLAPTFEPSPAAKSSRKQDQTSVEKSAGAGRRAARQGKGVEGETVAPADAGESPARASASPSSATRKGGGSGGRGPSGGPAESEPAPVRIADATGDLSTSTESPPSSADIVEVVLDRTGDRVEVRTTFADAVPTRQSGSKGMNVASFYDVDGNGYVDYEIWASLADDGWGTGYLDDRRNEASFGSSSGIEVAVQGSTLVVTFPWDRIGNASRFRWQAASEWGSYESMAASTSARDRAPDQGAAGYPG